MSRIDAAKTLFVMALRQESQGKIESLQLPLLYTGVGLMNATLSLSRQLTQNKFNRVINLGTAGSRKHPVGTLLEVNKVVRREPVLSWLNKEIILNPITDLSHGVCASADHVETGETALKWDLMDMEAYAFAHVCKEMGIAFHAFKYVTDTSDANSQKDWEKSLEPASAAFFELVFKNLSKF